VAPVPEKYPALQTLHVPEPAVALYFPAVQLEQAEAPSSEYFPAVQVISQPEDWPYCAAFPAGQFVHDMLLGDGLNVPLGQFWHDSKASNEYWPAGQFTHQLSEFIPVPPSVLVPAGQGVQPRLYVMETNW
jgi:hypothetical protein